VIIDPAKKIPAASALWGSDVAGKAWRPSIYIVDLYVNGEKIANGIFYMN
jgi:hypothetical protein